MNKCTEKRLFNTYEIATSVIFEMKYRQCDFQRFFDGVKMLSIEMLTSFCSIWIDKGQPHLIEIHLRSECFPKEPAILFFPWYNKKKEDKERTS